MTRSREPYRAPFEERKPAGGPPVPERAVSPTPPPRVRPAWYRRPLPRPPRWAVLAVIVLLLAGGVAGGIVAATAGSGTGKRSPSATASTSPLPSGVTPTAIGEPAGVVQNGTRVGTVTLLEVGSMDRLAGAASRYGAFMTFRLRFDSPAGTLYYAPSAFDVTGANAGPVIAGGRAPQLGTADVGAAGQVTAYLTIDAPEHGTLLYSPDVSGPVTVAWTY